MTVLQSDRAEAEDVMSRADTDMGKMMRRNRTGTRYNESSKNQVPRLQSPELSDRVKEKPLSKNELVEYLIRLQSTKQNVNKSTYIRLMQQPKFKEILDEVQVQRMNKRECRGIMEQCEDMQDNTAEVLSRINCMIGEENLRQTEFNSTLTII